MKNHKIGIITYHNAINYGAALQTYALNKYINNMGYTCETINYNCDKINQSYKLINLKQKSIKSVINSIINIPSNIVKKIKFTKFKKNNIIISKEVFNKNNITKANEKYDIFITGSDQVWNLDLNDDYNYYLKFVNNKNSKNSYAASFGNIKVLEENSNKIKEILNDYRVLSVREKSTINELKEKCNIKSKHVLDPTFLLSKEEWEKLVTSNEKKEKYILLYVLHEESAYYIAERLGKLTGLKVYIITESRRKRIEGKYIRQAGPLDFITLIKNSEYVVTDSFHGTALSIIFNKNLKVVLKTKMKYFNERLTSIIETFGMQDCIVDKETTDEKLIETIDYKKNKNTIEECINASKKVIKEIVD